MHRESILKHMLGELKYQQQKIIMNIDLIDKYINRIEENIANEKCLDEAMVEEYKNKDLIGEVNELLKDLKGDKYGE